MGQESEDLSLALVLGSEGGGVNLHQLLCLTSAAGRNLLLIVHLYLFFF